MIRPTQDLKQLREHVEVERLRRELRELNKLSHSQKDYELGHKVETWLWKRKWLFSGLFIGVSYVHPDWVSAVVAKTVVTVLEVTGRL